MNQPDSLMLEFALHGNQLQTLLSVQRALVTSDIQRTQDAAIKNKKIEWVRAWTQYVAALDNKKPLSVREDLAEKFCRDMANDPAARMQSHLIVLEAATFKPYFPLAEQMDPKQFSDLAWQDEKETVNDLSTFATALGLPPESAARYKDATNSAVQGLSSRWGKLVFWSLAGAVVLAVTGGLAAPAIGGAIGAAMGLSGAAAVSAGLAFLGGGALAVGGLGMAGGTALIIGGGALVGMGTGAAVAKLTSQSSEFMLLQAAKLEVVLREIVIGQFKDASKAREIIKAQRTNIASLENALDDLKHGKDDNKIKNLERSIEYLKSFFNRNKDIADSVKA